MSRALGYVFPLSFYNVVFFQGMPNPKHKQLLTVLLLFNQNTISCILKSNCYVNAVEIWTSRPLDPVYQQANMNLWT